MSSIVNLDNNNTLPQNDKYRLWLIYMREEDGSYGGAFRDFSLVYTGGVSGKTFQEMYDQAYEVLEEAMVGETYIPFDVNNMKESVIFDCVECKSLDEMDLVFDLASSGNNINEVLLKLQE
jgi:predicted RNase H-like HicB family nuclease